MDLKPKSNVQESARARRIRKAVQITGTQLMPKLCKISFWSMIGLTALTVVLECVLHTRYYSALGMARLWVSMSQSLTITWIILGAITVVASLIQLLRLRRGTVETHYVHREIGDERDPFEVSVQPERKYYLYIKTAVIGTVVLLLYGILSLLG